MQIDTSELTGAALDWAVAKCEGLSPVLRGGLVLNHKNYAWGEANYSTNWAQGGSIIEKMGESGLILMRATCRQLGWRASLDFPNRFNFGPTPLIAAMRCYVASKMGETIDIPNELNEAKK